MSKLHGKIHDLRKHNGDMKRIAYFTEMMIFLGSSDNFMTEEVMYGVLTSCVWKFTKLEFLAGYGQLMLDTKNFTTIPIKAGSKLDNKQGCPALF